MPETSTELPKKIELTPDEIIDRIGSLRGLEKPTAEEYGEIVELAKQLNEHFKTNQGIVEGEKKDICWAEEFEWKRILGVDLEIPPLPEYITYDVKNRIEREGFEIVYKPPIDIDLEELKNMSVDDFLKNLQNKYPKWKRNSDLTEEEKKNFDPEVFPNVDEKLYQWLKSGELKGLDFSGRWMAVETFMKPSDRWSSVNFDAEYRNAPFTKRLGLETRFGLSYDKCQAAIRSRATDFSIVTKMPDPKKMLRLLDPIEYNLFCNRFGWGKAKGANEWVETDLILSPGPRGGNLGKRVIALGGDGGINYGNRSGRVSVFTTQDIRYETGFRLAVDLAK
jgi:hypothetical protein